MSLTVTHINADSTFLLVFRPAAAAAPALPPSPGRAPGGFSMLLDPWLVGKSTIISSRFSVARHSAPACVPSLRDLPSPPDLVLISQEKPDHCHEETLRQLDPGSRGIDGAPCKTPLILAEPSAAKRIRSWKHFSPDRVQALERWEPDSQKENNIRRLPLPASSPLGRPGEVSIAFISKKKDISGLHTAIGITYRPPSTQHAINDSPITPPASPSLSPVPSTPFQTSSSYAAVQDRTISVIYSPHGVPYSNLRPYASQHLVKEAALPLTLLLHSFDRVQGPWWLGGNVSAGSPGGVEIARNLETRCWISAHDEVKDLSGAVVPYMRTKVYTREDVEALVGAEDTEKGRGIKSEILVLAAGQKWSFGPT